MIYVKKYADAKFTTAEAVKLLEKYPKGFEFVSESLEAPKGFESMSRPPETLNKYTLRADFSWAEPKFRLKCVASVGNSEAILCTIPLDVQWTLYQKEVTMTTAYEVYMQGGHVHVEHKGKVISLANIRPSTEVDPNISIPFDMALEGKWYIDFKKEDLWIVPTKNEGIQASAKVEESATSTEVELSSIETQTE